MSRIIRLIAVALALCAGAWTPAFAADDDRPVLELAVLARATVASDRVVLRDIVSVVHDDANVAPRVLPLDLGPAPRVGQVAQLQESQVEEWLRTYRPAFALRIRWSGAGAVQVERASQIVPPDAIDALARHELDGWLAARSDSHTMELLRAVEPVPVLTGRVSMTVRPVPHASLPSSHMTVWVDIAVDGRFQRSVSVDYQVRAMRRAWVAVDDLAAGQDLDASRVAQATIDVAQTSQALWSESPEGSRVRHDVRRGQALTALDVETRPAVARGEQVAVFSGVGDLAIETMAEALQDGRPGQDVMVRIATSREPVMARVLKPGLVGIRQ